MRKLLLVLWLCFVTLLSNAQIYTSIKYLDKFDDEVKVENVKTIVEKTDSSFIVETKGKEAVEYIIFMNNFFNSAGSDDTTINLFDNVYGYQESWFVMTRDDFNTWIDAGNLPAEQFLLLIVHRVIKTQYTHDFKNELFWIQDSNHTHLGKNVDRIIYIRN